MVEQNNPIYIARGSSSGSDLAQRSRPSLRICQDCDYKTFAHYVKCPRCNSEKWTNQ